MKYKLVYAYRAAKDIKRLDKPTKSRIGKALTRYKEDPFKYAERLSDSTLGTYRFRVGDYRIIFDIDDTNIVILRVGHRKEIYKRK